MNPTLSIFLFCIVCVILALLSGWLSAKWVNRHNKRKPMPVIHIVAISGWGTPPFFMFVRPNDKPKPPKQVAGNERLSNCCGAKPRGETDRSHAGFCNRCGDGAVFENQTF